MIIQKLNVHYLFRMERRVKHGIGAPVGKGIFVRVSDEKHSLNRLNSLNSPNCGAGSLIEAPLNRRARKQIFKDPQGRKAKLV